ncbi:acyltransferase [Roseomonas sp. KE2513]|uniref:acyltransferase family protein n=1 Tax=Roseomonas sp. KE2513 TaxID=2479202 RepID=UPI0018DFFA13|nr:acyltransferase [Roseomonas sp. KE2513]MBI0538316.1 acyltransferase [Roseomonas sp. KE2513]
MVGKESNAEEGRILFLDYLRALAVLLVVWAHIFIVGVNNPESMAPWLPALTTNVFGSTAVFTNPHGQLALFFVLKFGVSSGPVGVALFFLISGFVILRSVDRISPISFLVQRAFRIFPTCATVVIAVALLTGLYCTLTGTTQPHSLLSTITSSFALSGFFQLQGTLPVLWSLTVELAFYLLIALAVASFGRLGFRALISMALACLGGVGILNSTDLGAVVSPRLWSQLIYASTLLIHITFMLIGSALYRGFSDKRPRMAAIVSVFLFGIYVAAFELYRHLRGEVNIGAAPQDALAALVIMAAAFWAKLSWRWLRPLRFVADISYPLYLVHTPIGWAVLVGFGTIGWNLHVAALGATLVCVVLSWMLHVWIELPSQRLGKRLTRSRQTVPATGVPVGARGKDELIAAIYEDKAPGLTAAKGA